MPLYALNLEEEEEDPFEEMKRLLGMAEPFPELSEPAPPAEEYATPVYGPVSTQQPAPAELGWLEEDQGYQETVPAPEAAPAEYATPVEPAPLAWSDDYEPAPEGPSPEFAWVQPPPEQPSGGGGLLGGIADFAGDAFNAVNNLDVPFLRDMPKDASPLDAFTQPLPGPFGDASQFLGDTLGSAGAAIDRYGAPLGDSQLVSAEQAGRFLGEGLAPTTWGEAALSPIIGLTPGLDDVLKKTGRGLVNFSDEFVQASLKSGTGMVPEGAVSRTVAPPALLHSEGSNIPRLASPTEGEGLVGVAGASDDLPASAAPHTPGASGVPVPPAQAAEAGPDAIDPSLAGFEYTLKRLQQAEDPRAELDRLTGINKARIAEQQANAAQGAKARFSNTGKQEFSGTYDEMAAAQAKARLPEGAESQFGPAGKPSIGDELYQAVRPDWPEMWASAAKLNPEQQTALRHFTDMTEGVIDHDSTLQRVYDAARPLTNIVSGNVADSRLAEVISREAELRTLLSRLGTDQKQIEAAVNGWRDGFVRRHFKGPDYGKARAELRRYARIQSERNAYDTIAETWKQTGLNGDIAIFGQQVEAALRRGSVPTATGVFRDSVNRIASRLHLPMMPEVYVRNDLDHVTQAIADGLQMGGGSTADLSAKGRSLFGYIPGVGKKVETGLDKLADVQYGSILGTIRLRAYEGLLMQNKIVHALTLGKLGGDIKDPLVRRHIAEMANMIGSTSRVATAAQRAKIERRGLLTARMTRAQVNEVLTPLKSLRSQEDVINTLNLIGSMAATVAAGKTLHDQFGIGEFVTDPFEFGFGQITTNLKDSDGKNTVFDIFPQASFSKALLRSALAIKSGDMEKLADAVQRYGFGRLNMPPSIGLSFLGYGYNEEGKFRGIYEPKTASGDEQPLIPWQDRFTKAIPAPLTAKQAIKNPTASGIATAALGQSAFPESTYGAQDRISKEMWGGDYRSVNPVGQAKINAQLAAQGVPFDFKWQRTQPYEDADKIAFQAMQKANPNLAGFESIDAFRAWVREMKLAEGASQDKANEAVSEAVGNLRAGEYNWTALTQAARKMVVNEDPGLVEFLSTIPAYIEEFLEQRGRQ